MPDDPHARFRAHMNYIDAFSQLGGYSGFIGLENALGELHAAASPLLSDNPPTGIDLPAVHQSLRNAWSTELLLALPGLWATDDEFVRLSNTWGVVQAYYVGYHATQALLLAKGMPRPSNHPQTQKQFAALWVDRPLELPPWTFGATHTGWRNLPSNEQVDLSTNAWTSANQRTRWSLAGKALHTTRRDTVKDALNRKRDTKQRQRRDAWRAEEAARLAARRRPRTEPVHPRPNLTEAEKADVGRAVRTHTLLDYLYRLRIGANYDDAAVFFDGPDRPEESGQVHRCLVFLAAGTMLLSEIRVSRLVGRRVLKDWASDFAKACLPAGQKSIGLALRIPLW